MHHQAVTKSNLLVESSVTDQRNKANNVGSGRSNAQPLCPKPRRPPPEFLKPLRCTLHSQPDSGEKSGVLNLIIEKNSDGRETVCSGCLPSCYSGSPPRRTENPLVHDVKFLHQMELVSPFSRTQLF